MKQVKGGVTAAKGFEAASTAAGIKYKDRTDMALVYSQVPCVAAGTFTTNVVKAAPVKWDQQVVKQRCKSTGNYRTTPELPMHVPVQKDLDTAKTLQMQRQQHLVWQQTVS